MLKLVKFNILTNSEHRKLFNLTASDKITKNGVHFRNVMHILFYKLRKKYMYCY